MISKMVLFAYVFVLKTRLRAKNIFSNIPAPSASAKKTIILKCQKNLRTIYLFSEIAAVQ